MSETDEFELNDAVTIGSVHGYVSGYVNAPLVKVRLLDGQLAHYPRGRIRRGHLSESDIEQND